MRVVVDHASVVVPEQKKGVFEAVEHAARQPQCWARLQVLLGRAGDVRFGLGHLQVHEQRDAGVRGHGALVEPRVSELHELDVQLPVLKRIRG